MTEHGDARGINLSLHETIDDWANLRAHSVHFASITVTESINWFDSTAARQLTAAFQAGVHAGIRHYARPGAAQEQAKHLVRTGMPLGAFAPGALAPALDVGAAGVDDRFIKSWIKALRHASGTRRVLVYAGYEDWVHRFRPDKWADSEVVLWLVRHNGIPGRPGWFHARLGLHQHGPAPRGGADALVYPFTLADVLL
ncbi:GH25 family lysozyme [Prauserella muralis]|uniref:Lysozyme n=1 Tax=Prauserella muralis TaxID=588067 RepID=A0A2V4AZC9_9PSEU|nr:GH25 family lysozyme [Prauserella muralis]PXY21290.1 lysozyme [Prauserella muralis]TWE30408.1 glycosyl hydrolase family 25 [Prauserella muralis]